MNGGDSEWNYPCSDDELTRAGRVEGGEWAPRDAELEALYEAIEAAAEGKAPLPPLEWRNPGRRAVGETATIAAQAERAPERPQTPTNSNFDFMDEMGSLSLKMRREGEDTLRGSAKKKTTSFDGIVSNIIRHKRMQQMERNADNSPSS